MNQNKPETVDKEALVYGGKELEVIDRQGQRHTVTVRALYMDEIPRYIDLLLLEDTELAAFLTLRQADEYKPPEYIAVFLEEVNKSLKELAPPGEIVLQAVMSTYRFVRSLTDESIWAINDLGEKINDPRVALWEERQTRRAENLEPRLIKRVQEMKATLPIFSPTSAPSTAAGERKP